jgi:putative ABC transport system permease protein
VLLILSWTIGLVRRRPANLLGAMAGVGLALALLACLGGFVNSSVKTMTARAISALSIDWQILLRSPADENPVRAAIQNNNPKATMETVSYADVPGLEAQTGGTVQATGAATVLGIDSYYIRTFRNEIALMAGAEQGVLAAQQTAANLHVSVGDTVTIRRAPGLPPTDVKIGGIISLPDAESIFQKVGSPSGTSPQAPPDNVLVLPAEMWRELFREQMAVQPDFVRSEIHVRTARLDLPTTPEAAYAWELGRTHHLEASMTGRGVIGDNLASRLGSVRADALYARILFLFLGLPGLLVAALLTLGIAGSGAVRRRQQQALLRTRGASVKMILTLASAEAALVGLGGSLFGALLALAVSAAFKSAFGVSSAGVGSWLLIASCAGLVLALAAVFQPAWQDARRSTVAAARRVSPIKSKPLWQRAWLDVGLLAIAAAELWWMSRTGYELVFAPEGTVSTSVHYEAFAGPFCLWVGAILVTLRLFRLILKHGLRLAVKLRLPPFAGKLSRIIAASLARQQQPLSRAMALVALAFSFAVSTAIFNATYQAQSRVDAELTNGADVTVSGIPSAAIATTLLSKLESLPNVIAARAMQHGYAYVGNDLQDIYGIDPKTFGEATQLADAYFADGGARAALARLADQPKGVLVSDETVSDFQLRRGDELNLRVQSAPNGEYHTLPFRFIGVVREFPTAPKDSFLVVNSAYLSSVAHSATEWMILIRTDVNPSLVSGEISRAVGPIAGLKTSDIASAQRRINSSLSAIELGGLTLLELSFAVVFVVAATGLALFLSLSERRRSFAVLSILGAKCQHLAAFMWSEAMTILVGGGLVGICVGGLVAFALVKVLAGVFDPPPEFLTVPWTYLLFLCGATVALTAAAVALHLRKLLREPVISDLRSGV